MRLLALLLALALPGAALAEKKAWTPSSFRDLDAAGIGIGYRPPPAPQPPPPEKRKLGPIDQWRYESCLSDAAKAPTERGVSVGLSLCREKFGQ